VKPARPARRRAPRGRGSWRLLGRLGVACVALVFVTVVCVQFARIIGRNLALTNQLRATEADVQALEAREAVQRRWIARLSDPHGAIPEIHDKLHLVNDGEAIIYLKRPHGT
jgi:cell division protein FtsB